MGNLGKRELEVLGLRKSSPFVEFDGDEALAHNKGGT